ncbi:MAG: valine--tRNA ligase [Candidatus Curtissbacteria bacterium]|nr:valine--tRNA ligase [Candidatus Curtissbacteria bacterium]
MKDEMITQKPQTENSEKNLYDFWQKENLFAADPSSSKKPYSLLIPPPNLTGELHLGHAMQHSILDALARFKRLQGFDVLLLPGVDHAGIQFETTFDKKLAKDGLSKQKLGREEWMKKAWEFKEEIYKAVSSSWRLMGLSADWNREVFTLDPGPQKAVFEEFKTYFDRGLIYKGPYIVQWCPKDKTAIEDVEMDYEERKENLYYIKYKLVGEKDKNITIATVRPETMFADVAVAVNPKDKRYKDLIGKKVLVPFVNREVPIVADDGIDIKFGSGALKVDPAHSITDYEIGMKHDLEVISVIRKDGKLNENAGKFAGQNAQEVRRVIVEELEKKGAFERIEEIVHSVPVCERCRTTIEPLISEEWFLKVDDLAKGAIEAIKNGEIKFLPKNYEKILTDWLENIHDWCISRSLWWGHRIPVWYKDGEQKVSLHSPGEGWKQDEQVLDTWFSSGLWPMSTLGWPDKTKEFERYFPWDFEISAPEIKYLWIARMIMISKYFTGKSPFKTMFFHGMLRDLEGRKFSKSLGNGIEPTYLIDNWGVDATRMALYTYSVPGRDGRVSKQITDERGKNFRNYATKIRNIARFILELKPEGTSDKLSFSHADDKHIKKMFDEALKKLTSHLERAELHLAVDVLYNFVWHDFADVYIEKTKNRRVESQPVLEYILRSSVIVLHPFMPFVTEEIYQKFENKKKSIMLEEWPK